MIKKLITLFKLGRKVAKSDILNIASKFKKPPVSITILFQLLSISFSKNNQQKLNTNEGERLSNSLESMGTTFIKLGQFLATRPDIIGEELSAKLENLQDRLPPFSINQAQEIIKKHNKKFLNKQGYLLICDFFKRDVRGKSPVSGGHKIKRFLKYMERQPFTKLTDLDITKEAAPSLDIMRDLIQEVIAPTWNIVAYYMRSNYPRFTKMFSFAFRKKIAQAHRKYLSGSTSGEQFAHFKTYRLFLYQQKG